MSDAEVAREQAVRIGKPMYGGLSEALPPGGLSEILPPGSEAGAAPRVEVPFAIEGELVQIAMDGGTGRRASAEASLRAVVEPSPERVQPGCRHFGSCGGCHYQHMSQPLQARTKARILSDLLRRAGVDTPPLNVETRAPWGYRNRVRMRVDAGRVGYSRRGSHAFLPIEECPILSPLLWHAAQTLVEITGDRVTDDRATDGRVTDDRAPAKTQRVPWPTSTAEVELFATGEDGSLQMSLHVDATVASLDRDAPAAFRALCKALRARVPELAGGGLLAQGTADAGASRRVQERQRVEVARWGEPGQVYSVNGRVYPVSRNAFFQVNRFLSGRLVDLVVGGRSGGLALDLFAGAGLFSVPLSERFSTVFAVEIGEPAATDLQQALRMRGPEHRAIRQTTLAFLNGWQRTGGGRVPDLVVMDPPRAGVGSEALQALVRLDAPEIVYVSCDPTTFARDARTLLNSRYAVAELHALDLFPQTFHMETVAVFRRV